MADADIELSLRNAVRAHHGEADFTINKARAIAREELDLDHDFFTNAQWKSRSKEIVHDQNEKCDHGEEAEQVEVISQAKRKSLKRPSPGQSPQPRKKSKVTQVDKDEGEDEDEIEGSPKLSDVPSSDDEFAEEVKPTKRKQLKKPAKATKSTKPTKPRSTKIPKSKPKKDSSSELSDAPLPSEDTDDEPAPAIPARDDDTSSQLSSVIDEDPPRKKSKAKNGSSKVVAQPRTLSTSKSATEADPNSEEIKRLQGWLAKCGIRKVWGKELKPFESSKAKINHLKSLLADVGMTGRYSNEKAAQIREARELAADIEAVQEGNERWGKGSDEEDDATEGGRPKRRLIRGAQNYDFLSSDGEETD